LPESFWRLRFWLSLFHRQPTRMRLACLRRRIERTETDTPGKKPPAPSAPRQTVTLLLRKMRAQARVEGLNPDIWAEDDYAIIDPGINKRVSRIYPETAKGEPKWLWFFSASRFSSGSFAPEMRRPNALDGRGHIWLSGAPFPTGIAQLALENLARGFVRQ
jgi:hypothetical protein